MRTTLKLCSFISLAFISSLSFARPYAAIESSGVLKVGVPADYAPLAYYDETKTLVGFDIDMANDFAKSRNLRVEFVISSWPTLSSDLKADKFDVAMGGVTHTEKRDAEFMLTDAILPNGKIALARCSATDKLVDFDTVDHPSTRLVVNPGGTNQSFVDERIKQAQVIRVKDNFENLQALRDQTADVMITDLIEGNYYHLKEPKTLCLATKKAFSGTESYKVYMINKDNISLLQHLNQWLTQVNKEDYAEKWGIQLEE